MEVVGGFLDGMYIDVGDGLNWLVGGRGTGKISILAFIRWALDPIPGETEENLRYRSVDRVIQADLGTGRVAVEIETLNGIRYRRVSRGRVCPAI